MWKKPNRPSHEVSQSFNSGVVKIYETEDISVPGYAPKQRLKEKAILRYEEQRTGITRYYTAKQANIEIARVLRCPRMDSVNTQDVAETEDGGQYRIEQIQTVQNIYPACMDLSLSKVVQKS